MVYRGPSLGCERCIKKHKSCDRGKPACRRCLVAKVECPGYNDTSGVLFKDVTFHVISRETKRSQRSDNKRATVVSDRSMRIPSAPNFDTYAVGIHFFLEKYVSPQRKSPLLSRGHFDHLPTLYAGAPPSSALKLAAEFMGARAMFLYHGIPQTDPLLTAEGLAASHAVRTAFNSAHERSLDETLLAVLCMDFAEHVKSRRTDDSAWKVHTNGASALIRGRSAESFSNETSRSLLAAVMSNMLHRTLWSSAREDQEAIMHLPTEYLRDMSPSVQLHQELVEILRLESLLRMNFGDSKVLRQHCFSDRCTEVYSRLARWPERIPDSWMHFLQLGPRQSASTKSRNTGAAPHFQVAYLLAMWLCDRLLAIRLVYYSTTFCGEDDQVEATTQMLRSEAHTTLLQLQSILPCFTDDDSPNGAVSSEPGELLERNAGGVVRDSTDGSIKFRGGAPKGSNYLLNILHWIVAELEGPDAMIRGFDIDSKMVTFFRKQLNDLLAGMK